MASSPLPLLFFFLLLTVSISSAMETTTRTTMEEEEELAPSPFSPQFQDELRFNFGSIISLFKPKAKPNPRPPQNPKPPQRGRGGGKGDFGDCATSIGEVALCRAEFEVAKLLHFKVGKQCCDSVGKMEDHCFAMLADWIAPIVEDQCR